MIWNGNDNKTKVTRERSDEVDQIFERSFVGNGFPFSVSDV
jgi:hypothetical protein